MSLIPNPHGNYHFLKGIAPYSCGVKAMSGFEIVHLNLSKPMPLDLGFQFISQYLAQIGRPIQALCGMELRIPTPLSFNGFDDFNHRYQQKIEDLGLLIDKVNPLARTNIAPLGFAPEEPSVHAFSITVPTTDKGAPPTFIVAGAGDLRDQTNLAASSIIRPNETNENALQEKAATVLQVMEERLAGLHVNWEDVRTIDVYTIHPLLPILRNKLISVVGASIQQGIRWYYANPPIEGLAFEMDVRGVRQEIWI